MSTDADKALMSAVLSQIEVGKINYDKLAHDLNLPSKAAASMRWSRFKARLNITTTPSGAANFTVTTPQTTPSKKGKSKKGGQSAKKRKLAMSDDEDGDDERGLEVEGKPQGHEHGDWGVAGIPDTPSRKLPHRWARAANFKEEDETEGCDAFEGAFAGSRQGSTTVEGSESISEN